jgi:RsiW-degrading membrane proteinase PrsW (M82 family)
MWLAFTIKSLISLTPVAVFLATLLHLDSYKLVRFHLVMRAILAGGLLAMLAYAINGYALAILGLSFTDYSRYVAPLIEEFMKAAILIYLFRTNRIGFPVDAIILGFAVGTGFALLENMYYLQIAAGADMGVWVRRGLGTALMHGGTTAIFGALSQALLANRRAANFVVFAPGLVVCAILHAIFNHFPNNPLVSAVPVLLVLPVSLFLVFKKSEHAIHHWLETDFATHEELLAKITSGHLAETQGGQFIQNLASKLDPPHFETIVAYIRLHTELVLRADKILLAEERNIDTPVGSEIHAEFDQLHALERKLGRATFLTLLPHLHFTRLEVWELYQLEDRAHQGPPRSVVWLEHTVISRMHI